MTRNSGAAALRTLLDVLVPGDAAWPPASDALPDVDAWLGTVPADVSAWLRGRAADVFAASPEERATRVAALEQAEPGLFGRVLAAVYEAYYNSPAAHAEVVRLAEAGPTEPSPFFDPVLVDQVLATGAGRRRL